MKQIIQTEVTLKLFLRHELKEGEQLAPGDIETVLADIIDASHDCYGACVVSKRRQVQQSTNEEFLSKKLGGPPHTDEIAQYHEDFYGGSNEFEQCELVAIPTALIRRLGYSRAFHRITGIDPVHITAWVEGHDCETPPPPEDATAMSHEQWRSSHLIDEEVITSAYHLDEQALETLISDLLLLQPTVTNGDLEDEIVGVPPEGSW